MRNMTFLLIALLLLGACTSTPQLSSDVTAYSEWAVTRRPATYTFERLPGQEASAEQQQEFEDAARGALEATGFTLAADPTGAELMVQVGARARTARTLQSTAVTRHRPTVPGAPNDFSRFYPEYVTTDRREVALLIRDRQSGQILFGARASNRGRSISDPKIVAAMFEAIMQDFPSASENPVQVTVELNR